MCGGPKISFTPKFLSTSLPFWHIWIFIPRKDLSRRVTASSFTQISFPRTSFEIFSLIRRAVSVISCIRFLLLREKFKASSKGQRIFLNPLSSTIENGLPFNVTSSTAAAMMAPFERFTLTASSDLVRLVVTLPSEFLRSSSFARENSAASLPWLQRMCRERFPEWLPSYDKKTKNWL